MTQDKGKDTGPLIHAELQWDDQGQPVASHFDDVYFSRANGLAETRHVFLHHNQLEQRFRALTAPTFTVAETGFGSGLNFLATWQLWQQTAPAHAQLDFVSVEKHPLTKKDLARALALWPELSPFAQPLLNAYPCFVGTGFHRLNFAGGRVRLTLIIDDAAAGLEQLLPTRHPLFERDGAKVDAWFLDGFAPAKNPQMWSEPLFAVIGKLSRTHTTAATFSAAGIVKRGLQSAGFEVCKAPGFGHKREMISARYQPLPDLSSPSQLSVGPIESQPENHHNTGGTPPWSNPWPTPWQMIRKDCRAPSETRAALVIGAGLAGCHSARALADRGWLVTVLERKEKIADEASGNPQGILYAKLSPRQEAQAAFNLACLAYAQRHYQAFWQRGDGYGQACGVLQLAHSPEEAALHQLLQPRYRNADSLVRFVNARQATDLAGIPLEYGGLYFPEAGWLNPPAVCTALLEHPNIQVLTSRTVSALTQDNALWTAWNETGHSLAQAPVAVIASAIDALGFTQTADLPIKSIRGQVSYLPANSLSRQLRTVVCGEGYLAPSIDGRHCAGATFNLRDDNRALSEEDHRANLANLRCHSSALAAAFAATTSCALEGRVAFRCATRDYLPLLGPAPNQADFLKDYAPLRKNAKVGIPLAGSYWPGLFLNLGHGSRGLAYTPLCAELLAAQITGQPSPLSRDLSHALNPARFIVRDLIRNKR